MIVVADKHANAGISHEQHFVRRFLGEISLLKRFDGGRIVRSRIRKAEPQGARPSRLSFSET